MTYLKIKRFVGGNLATPSSSYGVLPRHGRIHRNCSCGNRGTLNFRGVTKFDSEASVIEQCGFSGSVCSFDNGLIYGAIGVKYVRGVKNSQCLNFMTLVSCWISARRES